MMITLTDSYSKKPVYIDPWKICAISTLKKTHLDDVYYLTQVQVNDNTYRVDETPEQVKEIREKALEG